MNEQPAGPTLLLGQRLIDGERRARHHIFVVNVGHDPHDAAGRAAKVDEFDHGIGPHHVAIHGVLIGEHALGDTLAYDDDGLARAAIAIVEIASGDQRDAEGGKKTGRDHTDPRTWIIFARRTDVAIG